MIAFKIIAHRGASGEAKENTPAAFRLADAQGADMIECDLRQSSDGEIVILHDARLKRVAGDPRPISRVLAKEARKLGIATLGDLFGSIPPAREVNLEVKTVEPARLLAEIGRLAAMERVVVSSFDWPLLARLRDLSSSLRISLLFERQSWERAVDRGRLLRAESLSPPIRRLSKKGIERAHRAGMRVYFFTVNDRRGAQRVIRAGGDGIFTDFPGRLRRDLKNLARS